LRGRGGAKFTEFRPTKKRKKLSEAKTGQKSSPNIWSHAPLSFRRKNGQDAGAMEGYIAVFAERTQFPAYECESTIPPFRLFRGS
jgi:hypothetical protein